MIGGLLSIDKYLKTTIYIYLGNYIIVVLRVEGILGRVTSKISIGLILSYREKFEKLKSS